jgi:hypothetical protein
MRPGAPLLLTGVFAAAFAACGSDGSGPAGKSDAELRFVEHDPLAPRLYNPRDSFWAKVGDGREIRLYYRDRQTPAEPGDEFVRFEVPGNGLYRRPDGTAFLPGDSILITVAVVDSVRLLVEFTPSGLRFNPDHPARLRIRYANADHDFDDDGAPDADDDEIEMLLDLWRQPAPGALWIPLLGVKFQGLDEIDANVFGFSRFAVAW